MRRYCTGVRFSAKAAGVTWATPVRGERRGSYHNSGQSNVTTTIAIKMDPQIMDVRLSARDEVSSLSKFTPDSETNHRLSG